MHEKKENPEDEKIKLIESKLAEFSSIHKSEWVNELRFCILTPQSKAQKCWEAASLLKNSSLTKKEVLNILKTRTRFHNRKTSYILEAEKIQKKIFEKVNSSKNSETKELRNWLEENIKGLGLKEASHFLRNIGKSNNQIAILDRHILKHLLKEGIIKEAKIKSKKNYLEIEKAYLAYAEKINIKPDILDMLWWSRENGEIFK